MYLQVILETSTVEEMFFAKNSIFSKAARTVFKSLAMYLKRPVSTQLMQNRKNNTLNLAFLVNKVYSLGSIPSYTIEWALQSLVFDLGSHC